MLVLILEIDPPDGSDGVRLLPLPTVEDTFGILQSVQNEKSPSTREEGSGPILLNEKIVMQQTLPPSRKKKTSAYERNANM